MSVTTRYSFRTVEAGQGMPIVFLHGIMGDTANWTPVLPYLPDGLHAVCLRFPFFDAGETLSSVEEACTYTEAFLSERGWSEYLLCGNSFGGHVAINIAARQPAGIAGLVLTGSSGLFERGFTQIPGLHPPREWIREKVAEVFYDPCHATDTLVDDISALIANRRNVRQLLVLAKSAKYDNAVDRLRAITCPTLLIWGKQDRVTPLETGQEFLTYLPHADFITFDHCGHTPMTEHPKQFMTAVTQWWQTIR